MDAADHNPILARSAGRRWLIVPVLLAVSLACNVTALVIPFMEINIFLKGTMQYSLPHSVKLMWEAKLYVISVLIVSFSIVFPFAKLAAQGAIWFRMRDARRRRRLLERIEPLGKWSFLDIFIVVVILILANDQLFIAADPRIGFYFFVAAIALSMISAALIEKVTSEPPGEGGGRTALADRPGWPQFGVPLLLVASFASLTMALDLPFLKVSQFLLAGHAYSVLRSVQALWSQGAYPVTVLVAATLVAMPVVTLVAMTVGWFVRLRPGARRVWMRIMAITWQWAMLDVFGLALLVFLIEGRSLIKTDVLPGLHLLVGAIAVLTAGHVVIIRQGRRRATRSR